MQYASTAWIGLVANCELFSLAPTCDPTGGACTKPVSANPWWLRVVCTLAGVFSTGSDDVQLSKCWKQTCTRNLCEESCDECMKCAPACAVESPLAAEHVRLRHRSGAQQGRKLADFHQRRRGGASRQRCVLQGMSLTAWHVTSCTWACMLTMQADAKLHLLSTAPRCCHP
jgi:hypothetical protein